MYICICKSLTEVDIQRGVFEGEVTCMQSLRDRLGASTGCGCCEEAARECLDQALARKPPARSTRQGGRGDSGRPQEPTGLGAAAVA